MNIQDKQNISLCSYSFTMFYTKTLEFKLEYQPKTYFFNNNKPERRSRLG